MKKSEIYDLLASKMVLYVDLIDIPVRENNESLVKIVTSDLIKTRQINPTNMTVLDSDIYIRESVAERLYRVAENLYAVSKNMSLDVVYGHRSLKVQTELFEKYKKEYSKQYSGVELLEAVQRSIAVPEVAGHPTGAAVDIRILNRGVPIDMGTDIWEFIPDSYTFSPFISKEAWNNRRLLRDLMKHDGFAPYDGEWWHFSYGDKEWAKYYNKPRALYKQVEK
ncbi:MAG: M15 family metallopeptidase [bacterium]